MHDDSPELGHPVPSLGAGERWALDQVRHHGVGRFIATMTAVAVVASGAVVTLWLVVSGGFQDPDVWVPALVLGTVFPALLAPPLLLFSTRLVDRLDTVSRLLRISAITDPLTGVANRRGFFAALDQLGGGREIEVAMVDIDNFKALNDEHGHAVGDAALRTVAAWLLDLVRDAGTVGRIGGDEFACVAVPDTFRGAPSRQRFELAGGVELTVSIGRARGRSDDTGTVLLAADEALYEEKQSRPTVRTEPRLRPAERRLEPDQVEP